jgi:aminomethyltransferase
MQKVRRSGGGRAGGFPGADTVLAQLDGSLPLTRLRIGLVATERVPVREHVKLENMDGQTVGEVTSGLLSPTLNRRSPSPMSNPTTRPRARNCLPWCAASRCRWS